MDYRDKLITVFMLLSYIIVVSVSILVSMGDIHKDVIIVDTHVEKIVVVYEKPLPEIPEPPVEPVEEPQEPVFEGDYKLLAHIINAEAGVEPYEGKIAVGNVIMNRVNHPQFPDTIRDVIYQKKQFQPVTNGAINKTPNEDSIKAAREVLDGKRVIDENVIYFYDPRISTSKWIYTREVVTKIGNHAFAI